MSFYQGTWQFMAGDLIQQFNIWHTFAHDLESFFWVILWIVLTQVQTYYTDALCSSFIHRTSRPKVCSGIGGPLKRTCLGSLHISDTSLHHCLLPTHTP